MGTCQNCLFKAVLTSTHNVCFEQKYEKYQNFLSEIFQFLVVKFSVYLNRHVFVMICNKSKLEKGGIKSVLCLFSLMFNNKN